MTSGVGPPGQSACSSCPPMTSSMREPRWRWRDLRFKASAPTPMTLVKWAGHYGLWKLLLAPAATTRITAEVDGIEPAFVDEGVVGVGQTLPSWGMR